MHITTPLQLTGLRETGDFQTPLFLRLLLPVPIATPLRCIVLQHVGNCSLECDHGHAGAGEPHSPVEMRQMAAQSWFLGNHFAPALISTEIVRQGRWGPGDAARFGYLFQSVFRSAFRCPGFRARRTLMRSSSLHHVHFNHQAHR